MALTDENSNGFYMPVAPAYGGSNSGNSGWGGDGWWILLLLLLAGGRGFGGYGGGYGGGSGNFSYDFPWVLNGQQAISNNVSDGFRSAELGNGITSIRDGISSLSTQLCGCCGDMNNTVNQGFANVQQSLCSGFAGTSAAISGAQNALAQQLYTNQISDLERSYAAQTANTQGLNALQSQFAQCCCDNRAATADLKYTIATENCADRAAISDGIRDIITAQTAGTQRILDQLCQDKIDSKNDTIAQLRSELLYARGQASQDVQTARLLAGQTSETDAIYNRLATCPVPCMPVYGMTPIFQCNNGSGCNCGNF